MPDSLRSVLARALEAYDALQAVGEDVEDEWSYIQDLTAAWRARIDAVVDARGEETLDPAVVVAVDRAIEEIGAIDDPHRAIDWLSTYPQIVLAAMAERP